MVYTLLLIATESDFILKKNADVKYTYLHTESYSDSIRLQTISVGTED